MRPALGTRRTGTRCRPPGRSANARPIRPSIPMLSVACKRLSTKIGVAALTASRRGAASVTFGAGAAAYQGQLPAFAARVAFVAFEPGLANLLLLRRRRHGGAVSVFVRVAVAVAVAVLFQRP